MLNFTIVHFLWLVPSLCPAIILKKKYRFVEGYFIQTIKIIVTKQYYIAETLKKKSTLLFLKVLCSFLFPSPWISLFPTLFQFLTVTFSFSPFSLSSPFPWHNTFRSRTQFHVLSYKEDLSIYFLLGSQPLFCISDD